MKFSLLPMIASVAVLSACASTGGGYHDAIKLQAAGINMSGSTGVTGGYLAATIDRSQNVDKAGKAIVVPGCNGVGQDSPDTYANLNSKASASAQTVAASAAGGVQGPSLAWASGDTAANGGAALVAAAATTAHPADTLAALCNNKELPSAASGSIVRDGVSPK